jgi:RHH-type proline utilization regulon transcriptional repressor/proline dehydrogenase/delta 1-pyrroline-5-carboxylate dehydrogenase
MDSDDLEAKVAEIARRLFSASGERPPVFDTKRWLGRIMDWSMKNEDFKVRLFRFIDVLPSLRSDEQVVNLLQEYFSGETELPKLINSGVGMITKRGISPRIVGPMIRKSVESFARQFIAGRDSGEVAKALNALREDGSRFSIDLLGEVVVSEKEAEEFAGRYLKLLDALHRDFPDGVGPDVSIKVTSLYSQLDAVDWAGSIERSKDALRPILRKAGEVGASITFDMEQYYSKELIIRIFKSILHEEEFKSRPSAGIAVQSYLKDSGSDVRTLIDWAREARRKISIRLVKGAYWDYEFIINRQKGWPVPVFVSKEETDLNFERLTRLLFENSDVVYPAIASHNLRSISYAAALADSMHLSRDDFEFQMLYGMAEPFRKALRRNGFSVRVYTPLGELIPGMAYLVRRLLENTSNESFLRKSFGENISFENLIKPPQIPVIPSSDQMPVDVFRNEPAIDFSIALNRKRMRDAIKTAKAGAKDPYPLLIGEREVRTGSEIISRDPAHPGETAGRVSVAGKQEADYAVEEALKACAVWRTTSPEKRASYLFRSAEAMRKQRFELAALEVIEVGKTWKDADSDVAEAIDYLEYYGHEMLRLGTPKVLGAYPGEHNEYRYLPKGIGVVIAPWNFPLAIAAGMTSAAIVAGNCVIFKPSGLSPIIGYRLCDLFRSVGLPPGVLQYLPGPGSEVGEYLVSHPAVDFIAFTGSKEVGLRIIRLAGDTGSGQRSVKNVTAEMGGKNAVIVDETADLDETVRGIVESAFGFQGQKCSACSRVIVIGDICRELCDRLVGAASSLLIGPPEEPGNVLGPVIDAAAQQRILSYIEIGKTEGKAVLEKKAAGEGYFIGPVIFVDAEPGSRIATEEIFGPILTILRARTIDEAVRMANSSLYALTGGLFSRSPANIQKVKEEFLVGNLYINRKITGALVGRQPFGGFGMSGTGSKAGGSDYLLHFLNPVSISENTLRKGYAPIRRE